MLFMKFYVYFLKSLKNQVLYIGSTENLKNRLRQHNAGRVKSTKAYTPWRLMDYEEFGTRAEAVRRERFLKTSQQKERLKEKFKNK